jgi:hypothetical protein
MRLPPAAILPARLSDCDNSPARKRRHNPDAIGVYGVPVLGSGRFSRGAEFVPGSGGCASLIGRRNFPQTPAFPPCSCEVREKFPAGRELQGIRPRAAGIAKGVA